MTENQTLSSVPSDSENEEKTSFWQKAKNAPQHPRIRKVAAYTAGVGAAIGGAFALAAYLKKDDDTLVLEPGTDYTVTDSTTETTQVTES